MRIYVIVKWTICYGIYYTILYSTVLVGGFNPSEKYEFVNGKDYPFIWKNKGHV